MSKDPTYNRLINSARWQRLRSAWLTEHPYCEECRANGRLVSARCVHHVTPVETGRTEKDMEALCFNVGNLRSLCFQCHKNIHKAERSHSKPVVKQRQKEHLERWIEKHKIEKENNKYPKIIRLWKK